MFTRVELTVGSVRLFFLGTRPENSPFILRFILRIRNNQTTTVSARCSKVLTTLNLCSNGWCEAKFKYWSVWVLVLYTLIFSDPSSLREIKVSRKGIVVRLPLESGNSFLTSPTSMTSDEAVHHYNYKRQYDITAITSAEDAGRSCEMAPVSVKIL